MKLALYQPDIPQNTGALLRLAACFGVALDIIEPCGFVLDDKRLKRVAMDYGADVAVTRFASWTHFKEARAAQRIILLSTKATQSYCTLAYQPDDILLLGSESAGVPALVFAQTTTAVRIPQVPAARSLNVAMSAGIVVSEALRQTNPRWQEIFLSI
jgi:tRNA (cytidine/uridine-2'-O-)-methyltransferase